MAYYSQNYAGSALSISKVLLGAYRIISTTLRCFRALAHACAPSTNKATTVRYIFLRLEQEWLRVNRF